MTPEERRYPTGFCKATPESLADVSFAKALLPFNLTLNLNNIFYLPYATLTLLYSI